MSFSDCYGIDYGELCEYEDAPAIIGGTGVSSGSSGSSSQLLSARYPSEMSMDLSELQDVLEEENSNVRTSSGSICLNQSLPLHQQDQMQNQNDRKNDDDGDSGFCIYRGNGDGSVNNSNIKFEDIPEDLFPQHPASPSGVNGRGNQKRLSTVDEQDESESSITTHSLIESQGSSRNLMNASNGSLRKRKVKFEISTRLEDIQEFEKPDIEDYPKLYYTAHELQKMIDGRRAEERRERQVVR